MPATWRPFLKRPFPATVWPLITEGWIYGPQEAEVYGGYVDHHAVDFAVPLGTPVLAAADGWALAGFEEVAIRYPGPQARTWHGEPVFWGYGLYVVVLHKNGLMTSYGHLHRLAPDLQKVYIAPDDHPNGDVYSAVPKLEAIDFKKTYRTVKVRAGQTIGYSGITGMGMGTRTYDNWLAGKPYRANDEEHLHFAVNSSPGFTATTEYIDPFGIYGLADVYPTYDSDWSFAGSLWDELV